MFHSMYGLRAVELAAAHRLRAAGCRVHAPDLFAGQTAPGELDAGFELMDQIGWATIVCRAREAADSVADDAVMLGFSMGVGVINALWPQRPDCSGVICLHAPPAVPANIPPGTPAQLHVASDDPFAPPEAVAAFTASAAATSVHVYPGAGHFYSDPTLTDYHQPATAATWRRVLRLIRALQQDRSDGAHPRDPVGEQRDDHRRCQADEGAPEDAEQRAAGDRDGRGGDPYAR